MKTFVSLGVALLIALPVLGLEVPLKDGTSITAERYTVTGSYVMLELENGQRVAYDLADVDVEALREAEAAADSADSTNAPDEGRDRKPSLESRGHFRSAVAPRDRQRAEVEITDHDVDHVTGPRTADDDNAEESAEDSIPEDSLQGGGVLVQGFKVESVGEDGASFRVTGEVVNRSSGPVTGVRAMLESSSGPQPWKQVVDVTSTLPAGETAVLSHDFTMELTEGLSKPAVSVSVFYQRSGPAGGADQAPVQAPNRAQ